MEKIDLIVSAPHFYTMTGNGVGYMADTAMAPVYTEPMRNMVPNLVYSRK